MRTPPSSRPCWCSPPPTLSCCGLRTLPWRAPLARLDGFPTTVLLALSTITLAVEDLPQLWLQLRLFFDDDDDAAAPAPAPAPAPARSGDASPADNPFAASVFASSRFELGFALALTSLCVVARASRLLLCGLRRAADRLGGTRRKSGAADADAGAELRRRHHSEERRGSAPNVLRVAAVDAPDASCDPPSSASSPLPRHGRRSAGATTTTTAAAATTTTATTSSRSSRRGTGGVDEERSCSGRTHVHAELSAELSIGAEASLGAHQAMIVEHLAARSGRVSTVDDDDEQCITHV